MTGEPADRPAGPGVDADLADHLAAWTPPWARTDDGAPADAVDPDPADDRPPQPGGDGPAPMDDSPAEPAGNGPASPQNGAPGPADDRSVGPADNGPTGDGSVEPPVDAAPAVTEPGPAPAVGTEPRSGMDASSITGVDPAAGPEDEPRPADDPPDAAGPASACPDAVVGAPDTSPEPSAEATPALPELDDPEQLRGALEAILMVVDEPVPEMTLAQILQRPTDLVLAALQDLSASYTTQRRGFDLRQAAGGWRIYSRDEFAGYVERFVLDGQQVRLTQAALETLAVVAYKQPVTRGRISAIRGVNCDGVVRTLLARGLIEDCGAEPDSGAYLYRTTSLFLERMGINSPDELPDLAPFLPDDLPEEA